MGTSKTFPIASARGVSGPTRGSFLIKIGQSHRPRQPAPRVIDLGPIRTLGIGRGDLEELQAADGSHPRFLLDDPWLSGEHARVVSFKTVGQQGYVLEDQGSTNGCLVNGRPVTRHALEHGDIVETGQTFWRFYQGTVNPRDELLELAHAGGAEITPTSSVSLDLLKELRRVQKIAGSEIPVILFGESGTGKEVMAEEIHRASGRPGRFLAINCSAIPEGLIESELFGHSKGAFTGATADKEGVVEACRRGTLLLDEIGDMPAPAQAKVLRLLQDRSFVRLGETATRRADLRFIAATHRDLEQMVEGGAFRGDLYARLNGLSIRLPPLRQRKEDIGLLLAVFLQRSAPSQELRVPLELYRALLLHDWPYNIRELEKTIGSAVALSAGQEELGLDCLPEAVQRALEGGGEAGAPAPPVAAATATATAAAAAAPAPAAGQGWQPRRRRLEEGELRELLVRALTTHGGNVAAAAKELDTTRMQVYRWLKRLDLDPASFRKGAGH